MAQTLTLVTGKHAHMCPGERCGMCAYFSREGRQHRDRLEQWAARYRDLQSATARRRMAEKRNGAPR